MKTPKYRAGDKVVIVSERTSNMNPKGLMDEFLGKIVTIRNIWNGGNFDYNIKEDYGVWSWSDDMIDHEATAKLNNKEEKTMETKAKLIIDGKEFEVTLPDSVIAELTKPKKVTGFEAAEYGKTVYCVNECGNLTSYQDYGEAAKEYEVANYYTNKALAEWCNRADTLNRKMRRWAAEHNTEPIKRGFDEKKWYLYYNCETANVDVAFSQEEMLFSNVYFNTFDTAAFAIAEFGDEIKWLAINRPEWF